jgi:hypothetical protein
MALCLARTCSSDTGSTRVTSCQDQKRIRAQRQHESWYGNDSRGVSLKSLDCQGERWSIGGRAPGLPHSTCNRTTFGAYAAFAIGAERAYSSPAAMQRRLLTRS